MGMMNGGGGMMAGGAMPPGEMMGPPDRSPMNSGSMRTMMAKGKPKKVAMKPKPGGSLRHLGLK